MDTTDKLTDLAEQATAIVEASKVARQWDPLGPPACAIIAQAAELCVSCAARICQHHGYDVVLLTIEQDGQPPHEVELISFMAIADLSKLAEPALIRAYFEDLVCA